MACAPAHYSQTRSLASVSIYEQQLISRLEQWSLSSTGSILSNTDLSDLSTVGTCDIFVYQMRHRVMWFARLADSILFIKRVITCHWNGFNENAMRRMFSKCFSANNMISLWLNTVIPIIVMIWLPNMTRYLQWRIIYRHLRLVTFERRCFE